MIDLVGRLRSPGFAGSKVLWDIMEKAADEIERLRAENERLKEIRDAMLATLEQQQAAAEIWLRHDKRTST